MVERLRKWPGVHCVEALNEGKVLEGWWFDRTQEYLARRRGESFGTYPYATHETLELAPLPCWKHLPQEQQQQLAVAMVAEIEAEAAERRERTGAQALGPTAILAQNPESRPLKTRPLDLRRPFEREQLSVAGSARTDYASPVRPLKVTVTVPPFFVRSSWQIDEVEGLSTGTGGPSGQVWGGGPATMQSGQLAG